MITSGIPAKLHHGFLDLASIVTPPIGFYDDPIEAIRKSRMTIGSMANAPTAAGIPYLPDSPYMARVLGSPFPHIAMLRYLEF
jgi:hypothetical protein